MEFRVARTREELEAAFALVHREYRRRGYVAGAEPDLRIILHNALPQTATFVGIDGEGRIAATATIVPDSPSGLPMDDSYKAEMDLLRRKGRPCEIVMLASNLDSALYLNSRDSVPPVFSFFKVMLDYTMLILEADFLCIAINPRHAAAFSYILFEDLGGTKPYRSVNNAPSVAKYLDLRTLMARLDEPGREIQRGIFGGRPKNLASFEGKLLLAREDLDYFFKERTDIFESASPKHLDYVACCYDTEDKTDYDLERTVGS